MKITVLKENATIKGDYFKVGEFYDVFNPLVFVKGLLALQNEEESKAKFLITFDPNEYPEGGE